MHYGYSCRLEAEKSEELVMEYTDNDESECSRISESEVDTADPRELDGPGPHQNGETLIVSDAESDYSGISNEDDEDCEDDFDDEIEFSTKEEEVLLTPKEEEAFDDDETILAEEVRPGYLLPVKEEIFSDASDVDFAGFDEPITIGGPAKQEEGLWCNESSYVAEEDKEEVVRSAPLRPSKNSKNANHPRKRKTNKVPIKLTSAIFPRIFHCYYCPVTFKLKAYLSRHVLRHLKDGSNKYEVTDSDGRRVHPAYVKGNALPHPQNDRAQQYQFQTFRGHRRRVYHCYYCPIWIANKAYLPGHVLDHLAKGDPKCEVTDPFGNKVHPAYLEDGGKYYFANSDGFAVRRDRRKMTKSKMKPYKCHLCDYFTNNKVNLLVHLKRKLHQAVKFEILSCFHCSFTTKWKPRLEQHMRRHIPGEFQCKLCLHTAHTPQLLKSHMRKHTNGKSFACNMCDKEFAHAVRLSFHLINDHKSRPHACAHCTFSATTPIALTEHVNSVHTQKNHLCPYCDFELEDVARLRSHCKTFHSKILDTVKCRFCDFRAVHKNMLDKHETRNHFYPEGFPCDKCAFVTKQKANLANHMLSHSCERTFACDLCEFKTTTSVNLKNHKYRHSNFRPFKCSFCEVTFKTKRVCRHHENYMHSKGGETFRCKSCSYETDMKRNLFIHRRTHKNDKVFACGKCEYAACRPATLAYHMEQHADDARKNHKCGVCRFRSTTIAGVVKHMRYVHPAFKPHRCTYCSATFRYRQELTSHEIEHTSKRRKNIKRAVRKRYLTT